MVTTPVRIFVSPATAASLPMTLKATQSSFTEDHWIAFRADVLQAAQGHKVRVRTLEDGVGIFGSTSEPSVVLQGKGSVRNSRRLSHELAVRYEQYAVRMVYPGTARQSVLIPTYSMEQGLQLLGRAGLGGTVTADRLEVDVPMGKIPNGWSKIFGVRIAAVDVERVSGERKSWREGHGIRLRSL